MDLQNLLFKNKIKAMGVINLTPDSFSDGSINLNSTNLYNNFNNLKKHCSIIDFGAESTAPLNDSISSVEELNRFEDYFFPLVMASPDPCMTISIDTYKPEVFYEVALVINKYWPKTRIIFNDISGQVDSELLYLLKDSLKFDYVLCHNLASNRFDAGNHMSYLSNDIVKSVSQFFLKNKTLLGSNRSIYADPCFGFSKTYEQNHELLKNLHKIDSLKLYHSVVIGISRKSFLRLPKALSFKENADEIEQIHSNILFELFKRFDSEIIVRTHNINPVKSALKSLEVMR